MLRSCCGRSFAAVGPHRLLPRLPGLVETGGAASRPQARCNWQVVLRKRLDRRTGKLRYENWDYLAMTIEEPQLPGGETLLNRHLGQTEHIKPTEARRRLQSAQVYRRSVKRLEDLKSYIKFTQEAERKDHDDKAGRA